MSCDIYYVYLQGMLVDLNKATEEELMTVNGISRLIARSIVEYRTAIGGFKQLQDLALVSGVGAAKMATLCQELTISEESRSEPHPRSEPCPRLEPNYVFSKGKHMCVAQYQNHLCFPN